MPKYNSRLVSHGHFPIYDKPGSRRNSRASSVLRLPQLPVVLLLLIATWAVLGVGFIAWRMTSAPRPQLPGYMFEPVLISYSYFEKDAIQVSR